MPPLNPPTSRIMPFWDRSSTFPVRTDCMYESLVEEYPCASDIVYPISTVTDSVAATISIVRIIFHFLLGWVVTVSKSLSGVGFDVVK